MIPFFCIDENPVVKGLVLLFGILGAALFIASSDHPTPEQRRDQLLQRIHDDCTYMGFKPGTEQHSNCQLQIRIRA